MFIMALAVMAARRRPPKRSRIFAKTIRSASLNFRSVTKSDRPFSARARRFLPASTPMTKSVRARPPVSFIFAQSPS